MATTAGRGCPHVDSFRGRPENVTVFSYVYRRFVIGTTAAQLSVKVNVSCQKRLSRSLIAVRVQAHTRCVTCKSHVCLYACLECVYVGCYKARHIHQHSKSKDHSLGLSLCPPAPR